jgi:hypothetical protein
MLAIERGFKMGTVEIQKNKQVVVQDRQLLLLLCCTTPKEKSD